MVALPQAGERPDRHLCTCARTCACTRPGLHQNRPHANQHSANEKGRESLICQQFRAPLCPQNPVPFTGSVGSIPSSGTKIPDSYSDVVKPLARHGGARVALQSHHCPSRDDLVGWPRRRHPSIVPHRSFLRHGSHRATGRFRSATARSWPTDADNPINVGASDVGLSCVGFAAGGVESH
jgi:hypothetical protein